MVPAGNKAKRLFSVNHATKTIHQFNSNKWSTGTFFLVKITGHDSNFLISISAGLFRLEVLTRVKPSGFMFKTLTEFSKKGLNYSATL